MMKPTLHGLRLKTSKQLTVFSRGRVVQTSRRFDVCEVGWPGFPGSYFLCHGCVSRELSFIENRMKVNCDILELRSILTLMEKTGFFPR